jgi:hypothetical protein
MSVLNKLEVEVHHKYKIYINKFMKTATEIFASYAYKHLPIVN